MGVGIAVQPFIVLPEWNTRVVPWSPTTDASKTCPQAKITSLSLIARYFNIIFHLHPYCSYREDPAVQVWTAPQLAISGNQNTCWEKWKLTDLWPTGTHLLPSLQRDVLFRARQLYLHSGFCGLTISQQLASKSLTWLLLTGKKSCRTTKIGLVYFCPRRCHWRARKGAG